MSTPTSGPAGQLLHKMLGSDYIADCNPEQLAKIAAAISENEDGVQQIIAMTRLSKTIKKPIPFILTRIDARAHLSIDQTFSEQLSSIALAERRYQAVKRRYPNEPPHTHLAYALTGDTSREFENELRRRVGLPLLGPIATDDEAARWQRIRKMTRGLKRDHPLRQAIRETCTPDVERSHDEALQVLAYLEAVADDAGLDTPTGPDPLDAFVDIENDTGEDPPPDTLAA